jgi:hypothetical protein
VLLSKVLTRSDANAKRVILRCKQVETSLGSRPVGQGHKLTVGLPCGGSCPVMVRAWANGSNSKPMYVLEQVDQLFKQQQLAAGDHVSLLVSADGKQHFLRWQRAGEAAEQLLSTAAAAAPDTVAAAAAIEPVPAAEPTGTAAAVADVAAAKPAGPAAQPAVMLEPVVQEAKGELASQQQQQQVQTPQPMQSQLRLAVQPVAPQPQQQLQVVVPDACAATEQQQQQVEQQQQQDDADAALLLLPLVGSMDTVMRTGCYLLCLQQGCMQPACLGCMSCSLHKRRRIA